MIETERLILRSITMDDADDIFEYSSTANVGPNAGWKPHQNREDTLEIMKLIFVDKDGVFGIILKETGKLIGSIGLIVDPKRENNKVRMLGYAISEMYWGRGYMTESVLAIIRYGFEMFDLDLISAYSYPHNSRSKRVLEKCGFTYEGTLKLAEKLFNGNVYANECWALLRPEKL